jgi:transposase
MIRLGQAVQPLINLMRDVLLESDVLYGDETTVQVLKELHAVLPQGKPGQALHYLHRQWPKLIRYVENGAWPISNNACENSIRPFVVERKAWLFADTVRGAKASMNLYSLIETCKANGVEPYAYLKHLFIALPHVQTAHDYEALLPWNLSVADRLVQTS